MNFIKWLKEADKEIQKGIEVNIDKSLGRGRSKTLLPFFANYKILQEQKKLTYQTWVLTVATWVLAIATIVLVIFRN